MGGLESDVSVERGVWACEVFEEVGETGVVHVDVGWGGIFRLLFWKRVSWLGCLWLGLEKER